MTTKVGEILEHARRTLLDEDRAYWSDPELIDYVNDGLYQIVTLRPQANAVNDTVQLTAGPRQVLPSSGVALIDVTRNRGSDGTDHGRAITAVEMRVLDRMVPGWAQETAAGEVQHYMYDDRDRTRFYVYPAQPDPAHYVEIVYGGLPTRVSGTGDTIGIDDQYAPALTNYVLHRAHLKDSRAAEPARAVRYWEIFTTQLGVDAQTQRTITAGEPDRQRGGLR